MAELLSALLPTLLKKAGDSLLTELAFTRGVDGRRKKLCDLLITINDVIYDAEKQASKKASVKAWIARLKSAALDADDAIDELHYEALRRDALHRGHNINSGVRGFFSMNYNPWLFKYKIGKRLQEIVERIDDLVNQMNQFGCTKDQPAPVVERTQTHSYVNNDDVVGRKGDVEKIMHMLVRCEREKLSIIAVIGIGGMGKTTLAQLVFNNVRERAQFQICVWVCVSDPFIVADVVKKIIDSAIGRDCGLKIDNMELLQQRFQKELGGKRYFLVLDDVWNQDVGKWDALRTLLGCGGKGSVVLATTREGKVASIMGTLDAYCLQHLSPEDSWTLFKRRAFSLDVTESPEFVEVGKEIVKKCCGVPLAVKSMSSLMSEKHEVKEWLAILESKTWDEENQILPALRLSYDHLPSHMKQCFTFCAVFPKDYEMNKQDLIHLWIANGFISSEGTLDLETIANGVFSELVRRSFFQDVKQARAKVYYGYREPKYGSHDGYFDLTTFKIHDLLHDLAQIVGHGEFFSLQNHTGINELPENVHHLHYYLFPLRSMTHLVVQHCRNIRSIFGKHMIGTVSLQDLYFPNSLRVFSIRIEDIERPLIEPAFVKHLRYLNLSGSDIITLPNSVSALYNLQVLVLNRCDKLKLLPEDMKYMISLRHVYLEDCDSLQCMPAHLGQLSYLQTLTKYIVGTDPGRGIKELKNLNLGGKLQIYDLMKLTDQSDAKEAILESKQNLEQLTLCWGTSEHPQVSPAEDSRVYPGEEILDALKPHNCLQVLNINGYPCPKFPRWVIDSLTLQKLIELRLSGCVNCTNIPPVCRLPCLEVLELERMHSLTNLCSSYSIHEEGCSHSAVIFPKLKSLSLESMELLERWKETDVREVSSVTFPVLDEMRIIDCPKLTTLPQVPVLKSLCVPGNRVLLDLAAGLTTLSYLFIDCPISSKTLNDPSMSNQSNDAKENILVIDSLSWQSLTYLTLRGFHGLEPHDKEHISDQVIHIKDLCLNRCGCFIQPDTLQSPLWFWKLFDSLKSLEIWNCDGLNFWPEEEFQSLTSLKRLIINGCKNFTGLPPAPLPVKPSEHEGLHNLEDLQIIRCPNLAVFPTSFPCLKFLNICANSKLESIPEGLGRHGTLRLLFIGECPSLKSLPASIQCPSNLIGLQLRSCDSLTALPEGMQNLTALKSLCILKCPGVKALPEGLQQRLHSLETFYIRDCPALTRRCKRGGDYWEKVKDIPDLVVTVEQRNQRSIWRDAARAIVPTCTNTSYRRLSRARQSDN